MTLCDDKGFYQNGSGISSSIHPLRMHGRSLLGGLLFRTGLFFWYSALERKDSIPVCCRNALPPGGGEVLWGDMKNLDI